jgi:hypothetical protein
MTRYNYLQVILISFGCILKPLFYCYFVLGHFDWSFTKKIPTLLNVPHIQVFSINKVL